MVHMKWSVKAHNDTLHLFLQITTKFRWKDFPIKVSTELKCWIFFTMAVNEDSVLLYLLQWAIIQTSWRKYWFGNRSQFDSCSVHTVPCWLIFQLEFPLGDAAILPIHQDQVLCHCVIRIFHRIQVTFPLLSISVRLCIKAWKYTQSVNKSCGDDGFLSHNPAT